MGWILTGQTMHNNATDLLPYVPELRRDKFHSWISRWHWVPITVLGVLLFVIGGWRYLLWGIFFRTVIGLHSTWLVNSATHMWGRQRFSTHDDSRNSFWVALLTFGEGWHNNHHAFPQSARHGMTWHEFDPNWYGISVLRVLGLAWDVKVTRLDLSAADLAREPTPVTVTGARLPASSVAGELGVSKTRQRIRRLSTTA
jgi:stearoyl-CoA desaturase (delta-9 desaturase)